MLTTEIRNKVQSLWGRLWSGGFSNPISAIEQISYLLFMKRLENFHSTSPEEFKWSYYHSWKGEALIPHIKEKVFPFIKHGLAKEGDPFALAMEDASFRINDPNLIEDAIKFIDEIYTEIVRQETEDNQHFQDIQGDVYEHLLRQTSEAGKNGQFRTPRHIIQMMTEIIDPDIDGKICDLACGSGGFLVGAYQYVITKYSREKSIDINGLPKGIEGDLMKPGQAKRLKEKTFFGFDIDQTMVRIGTMNLMMHGITKPNISHVDTLSERYDQIIDNKKNRKFKYILANPPFTGKINSLTISENLNRIYPAKFDKLRARIAQTVQSELLFLERIINMLEDGGRAGVIVPEGLLFNSGSTHKKLREILITDCELQGVISLPEGVFLPYTGVKTSILVFQKRETNELTPTNVNVWFYNMKSDGYSLDTNRRRLKDEPIPLVIKEWRERSEKDQLNRQLQHFVIPVNEIRQNNYELNINLYQDYIHEAESFEDTDELLEKLHLLESEIFRGLESLKRFNDEI